MKLAASRRNVATFFHTLWLPVSAMAVTVVVSNVLVAFPINSFLTWAAFTYPVAFLVTDMTNRTYGPKRARSVAYVGFALAVVLSLLLAEPRIALASGSAFLCAQLLDIYVFNKLRQQSWWVPPLVSSALGSVVDTAIFFFLAFAGSPMNWFHLALGDLSVKLAFAVLLLAPFRILMALINLRRVVPSA